MTILSRVTGLLREIVFANVFGATGGMDAFLVAFRIPNFLRRLFAEGAFSQAFVPTLSEYRQTHSREETQTFVNHMAGMLGSALLVITLVAMILAPLFVIIFAPGFLHDPVRFGLAATMLRVTFPYLLFISLAALAGSILNSYDRFAVPAFTPVLLNFAMIGAAVLLASHFVHPVEAAAWGVVVGGILQLLFQLPFLQRLRLFPIPKISWHDKGVQKVLRLMVPAIFGVSMAQIGFLVDTLFASFLQQGSISWLYYSDRLTNFPLGVFGVGIATVILPHLSRKHAAHSIKEYSAAIDWALKCILLIGIPSAIGFIMLAGPMLSTILQHGKFNAFDVQMSARSAMAFAVGLPSFMLVKILAASFYSQQDIKTPVKIAMIAIVANIIFNFILIFPLKHAGLALSTSITSSLNAGLLFYLLRKRQLYLPGKDWRKFLIRLGLATLAMMIVLWFISYHLSIWLNWGVFERVWHLGVIVSIGGLVYLATLFLSGMRFKDIKANV